MESYVVRIYRKDAKDPRKLVGEVERAEQDGKQTFHGADELLRILVSPDSDQVSPKPKRNIRRRKVT